MDTLRLPQERQWEADRRRAIAFDRHEQARHRRKELRLQLSSGELPTRCEIAHRVQRQHAEDCIPLDVYMASRKQADPEGSDV